MLLVAAAVLTLAAGRQPQMAAQGDLVALAYGSGNTIYFSSSRDGGRSFNAPVKVAETDAKLMLGKRRGPRIAIAGSSIVITAVTGGDLLAWRSSDEGHSWQGPARLNSVENSAREGLDGIAGSGRVVFATWLDLRDGGMRLYGAVSKDGGLTWPGNFVVYASPDGHICECCHPSALVASDGTLYAMWRNWLGGSRDLWYSESRDGGAHWSAAKLGTGTWPLEGCPMDGGGLVLDDAGKLHTVWRRNTGVFAAMPGEPEQPLGPGKDPAVSWDRGLLMAWIQDGNLLVKAGDAPARQVADHATAPVLAGRVLAWEQDGQVFVTRLGRN
jgi:hypothetical protein